MGEGEDQEWVFVGYRSTGVQKFNSPAFTEVSVVRKATAGKAIVNSQS